MKTHRSWFLGEFVGTFLLVFFGCGSVATAVAMGAQVGLFQVAIVWGFGVTLAILATAGLSGAHINPAITLAFAAWRGFRWSLVPGYILAQFCGALTAAATLYLVFGGAIELFEVQSGILRGAPGSEASAMIFGEFFPNPGGRPILEMARGKITWIHAFLAEALGTGLLAFAVFSLTDKRNSVPLKRAAPFGIGMALTTLISLFAPISMAGFNPARDFAPRLYSSFAGWGSLPFEVNGHGWLSVYIVAPIVGALMGGWVQARILSPRFGD